MVQPTPDLMRKFGQKRSDYEPDPFEQSLLSTMPAFARIEIPIKDVRADLDKLADYLAVLADTIRRIKRHPDRTIWKEAHWLNSAIRLCDGQIKSECQVARNTKSRKQQ